MSKTATETTELNLSKNVTGISEKLQKGLLTINDQADMISHEAFEKTLPDDLSMELVKRLQSHTNDFVAATYHASGALAHEFLKKNPKIDTVHLEKLPIGRDTLRANWDRKAEVAGIGGKSTTHALHGTMKYTSGSAGTSGAAVKRIRDHYHTVGADLYKA